MEQNSDRMGFALIALVVVAFVLVAMNTVLKPTVTGFFTGFKNWMDSTFKGMGVNPATSTAVAIDAVRTVLGK